MSLSYYLEKLLFKPFSSILKTISRPLFSIISFEIVFKTAEEFFKNQPLQTLG